MAKKLISVWLSLTVLIFSSISIYAEENIQGDFFIKEIVINGQEIDNDQLQFPFFLYKNTTYMPLTSEMQEICGLQAEMDWESRTLKLMKTESTLMNIRDRWKKNDREDIRTQPLDDAKVLVYEQAKPGSIEEDKDDSATISEGIVSDEVIALPTLAIRELNLDDLPLLKKGDILYIPVRALTGTDGLDWDLYFDSFTGVYISTKKGTSAVSYWKEAESKYNQGLVNYIKKYNNSYSTSKAQELVLLFKDAAKTYSIDEKVLVAVAHKESTFNPRAKSSSGSLGMMQILPSTAKGYGVSTQQLYDVETNINFGAMYLSQRLDAYNGDLVKGFSAYNQGSGAVNRGSYSTRYATRIIGTMKGIDSYLTSNGYGLGQ